MSYFIDGILTWSPETFAIDFHAYRQSRNEVEWLTFHLCDLNPEDHWQHVKSSTPFKVGLHKRAVKTCACQVALGPEHPINMDSSGKPAKLLPQDSASSPRVKRIKHNSSFDGVLHRCQGHWLIHT